MVLQLLLLCAALPALAHAIAPEPFPALSGGAYSGPPVPASPDPQVRYVWGAGADLRNLQIAQMLPVAAELALGSLGWTGVESLTGGGPVLVSIAGAGGLMLDFGVELPAWLEVDSPDISSADLSNLLLATGEYTDVDIIGLTRKEGTPKRYNETLRLETNAELYEGVRYGFLTMTAAPATPFTITGVRAVYQIKAVNYTGSFDGSDALSRIYYVSAYTVRTNLEPNYMGAILEDRGDRISWAGDAHVSQATSMAVFGNFWSIRDNLNVTGKSQNGIASYTLYFVDSVIDYWVATGDNATLSAYSAQIVDALDNAFVHFNESIGLTFFGWDDRLGSGFQNASCEESQWDYRFLAIHGWLRTADALAALGEAAVAARFRGYASQCMAWARAALAGASSGAWWQPLGIHAAGEAINTGLLSDAEMAAILQARFNDSTSACSLSNFNQFWLLKAMATAGALDRGLAMVELCWGPELAMGGTTFWEISSPDWLDFTPYGGLVPNGENGYTSLCHPWSAGPAAWLASTALGVRATPPGSAAALALGRVLVAPHLAAAAPAQRGAVPLGDAAGALAGVVRVTVTAEGEVEVELPAGVDGTLVLSEALLRRISPAAHPRRGDGGGGGGGGGDDCGCALIAAGGAAEAAPLRLWPSLAAAVLAVAGGGAGAAATESSLRALYSAPLLDEGTFERSRVAVLPLAAGSLLRLRLDCARGAAPAPPAPPPFPPRVWRAAFLGAESETRGSWRGVYGADGFALLAFDGSGGDVRRLPAYVASLESHFSTIPPDAWARGVGDARALEDPRGAPGAPANRSIGYYASAAGGDPTFVVDVMLAQATTFTLSIYFVDWDARSRRQTVALLDGNTFDPIAPIQAVASFEGGVWLSWRVSGSVRIRVSQIRGDNCVINAIMFGPPQ